MWHRPNLEDPSYISGKTTHNVKNTITITITTVFSFSSFIIFLKLTRFDIFFYIISLLRKKWFPTSKISLLLYNHQIAPSLGFQGSKKTLSNPLKNPKETSIFRILTFFRGPSSIQREEDSKKTSEFLSKRRKCPCRRRRIQARR